jgi:hypothetical protein
VHGSNAVGKDERGFLSTGVRHSVRPRLDSDGKYVRLRATNLETSKTVWIERERAPEFREFSTPAAA